MSIKIFFQCIKFIILITWFSSCKKFLDKKPNTSLAIPEKISDLQAILDHSNAMNEQRTVNLAEASTDNYYQLQNEFDRSVVQQHAYTWQLDPYISDNPWRTGYVPIYSTNLCLEVLQTIPRTDTNKVEWNNVYGSALFFRAYYFLDLTWCYSKAFDKNTSVNDLGISLKLTTDFNIPTIRATVKECYDRVVADTKESVAYLSDLPAHPFRPSRASAYGLLARAYLSMREYDSAFKYANLSLQIKNDLIDFNASSCPICDIVASFNTVTPPFKKFNSETLFYTSMSLGFDIYSTSRAIIDTILYTSYADNDLRKTAFFFLSGGYQRNKASYTQTNTLFSGITTAEMLISRAECYARIGDKNAALADLNTLLIKRWKNGFFVPVTATNAQDALAKILIERRKELFFRGLRWMDIKRLNKEGVNIVLIRKINGQIYTLPPNDDRYALPIPKEILDITGIQQNPGW